MIQDSKLESQIIESKLCYFHVENLYNEKWFFGRACKELLDAENPVGGPLCEPEEPGATWSRATPSIWFFIILERLELLAEEGRLFEPVKFWLTERLELWLTDKDEPPIGEPDMLWRRLSYPSLVLLGGGVLNSEFELIIWSNGLSYFEWPSNDKLEADHSVALSMVQLVSCSIPGGGGFMCPTPPRPDHFCIFFAKSSTSSSPNANFREFRISRKLFTSGNIFFRFEKLFILQAYKIEYSTTQYGGWVALKE